MAGKGGGSWKVAYADFVTAMMAFFLVMWIGSQDTNIRQSVANYFIDPSGVSKSPKQAGAVMTNMRSGPVDNDNKVDGGHGLNYLSQEKEASPQTRQVAQYLMQDKKANDYWKAQVRKQLQEAELSPEVREDGRSAQEVAIDKLAKQMELDFSGGAARANPANDVYQDLLRGAMSNVNWQQLAQAVMYDK